MREALTTSDGARVFWGEPAAGGASRAQESVGIVTGFLIAAIHYAGLASLTHTPSPLSLDSNVAARTRPVLAYRVDPMSPTLRRCVAAAISLTATYVSQIAQTPVDLSKLGPQVGAKAIPFSLPDQTGTPRELASLAGPNGTMLVFFRSADW